MYEIMRWYPGWVYIYSHDDLKMADIARFNDKRHNHTYQRQIHIYTIIQYQMKLYLIMVAMTSDTSLCSQEDGTPKLPPYGPHQPESRKKTHGSKT